VPDRTSEVAAAALPPVPEGTGGESSVSGTEDTSVSGTEVLTGSRAVDPSDESGSRTGNDYPTDSKGESPVESPKKTIGKESGQVPAEAGRRPKNKIPRKAETLRKAAEATQKFIENRRTQGDLEADEETQGVLSDEPSEEDQQEISSQRKKKWDNTRKELDKFEALRCVRLPLEEAQLTGRRRGEDPLRNLRNWSAIVQLNNDQRSKGLVRMYTWANEYLFKLKTVKTKKQPEEEENLGWMKDHYKQKQVLMHYLAKYLAYSDRTARMEAHSCLTFAATAGTKSSENSR
jgi:hypothetical protein